MIVALLMLGSVNEQTETIQAALRPKGFEDIDGGTILKCFKSSDKTLFGMEFALW